MHGAGTWRRREWTSQGARDPDERADEDGVIQDSGRGLKVQGVRGRADRGDRQLTRRVNEGLELGEWGNRSKVGNGENQGPRAVTCVLSKCLPSIHPRPWTLIPS